MLLVSRSPRSGARARGVARSAPAQRPSGQPLRVARAHSYARRRGRAVRRAVAPRTPAGDSSGLMSRSSSHSRAARERDRLRRRLPRGRRSRPVRVGSSADPRRGGRRGGRADPPGRRVPDPPPRCSAGQGAGGQLEQIHQHSPGGVVFDNDLTPAQVRNLEKATGARCIDRTELILDIFARRASTRRGPPAGRAGPARVPLPRLRRMWTHLGARQGGDRHARPRRDAARGGPPARRRRIRDLKGRLARSQAQAARSAPRARSSPSSLVGYTNAGKSR